MPPNSFVIPTIQNLVSPGTTFETWKQIEPYWVNGICERVSLIKNPFKNPIWIHPDFLPSPKISIVDFPLHYSKSLETLNVIKGVHDLLLFSPFLHWTHDVPGMLAQAHHALSDDGFFIACFFGQDTLIELKSICAMLDVEYKSGLQQRFLPTIHTKDAGMLMQRAGFESPVADIERITFQVPSVTSLISKLRNSGLTNTKGKTHIPYISVKALPHTFLQDASKLYHKHYSHTSGSLSVTVDLIFVCGWKKSALKSITR